MGTIGIANLFDGTAVFAGNTDGTMRIDVGTLIITSTNGNNINITDNIILTKGTSNHGIYILSSSQKVNITRTSVTATNTAARAIRIADSSNTYIQSEFLIVGIL